MMVMRLLVLFDLPTGTAAERKAATKFRDFLVSDGFLMEQFSVYSRSVATREASRSHIAAIRRNSPYAGRLTVIELTEKQYASRRVILQTERPPAADEVPAGQTVLVF